MLLTTETCCFGSPKTLRSQAHFGAECKLAHRTVAARVAGIADMSLEPSAAAAGSCIVATRPSAAAQRECRGTPCQILGCLGRTLGCGRCRSRLADRPVNGGGRQAKCPDPMRTNQKTNIHLRTGEAAPGSAFGRSVSCMRGGSDGMDSARR